MYLADARKYKKQIRALYTTAFPREERAPLFWLFRRTDNGRDSFRAVLDGDAFVGLVYTIQVKKLVYVFFLAVAEEKRGRGYGTEILRMVHQMHPGCTLTLAIEDTADHSADNYDQRIMRLRFYEANGYRQLNVRVNEAGVTYELLGAGAAVTQADFLNLMKDYLGPLLFKIIYRKTKFEQ